MSIQNLAKLAGGVLKQVKALPPAAKIGIAAGGALIFGAGMLVDRAIIGDRLEKTKGMQQESAPESEVELQQEETDMGIKLKKPDSYVSPQVSDSGRVDTIFFTGTKLPRFIGYFDTLKCGKEGAIYQTWEEEYNKDGEMENYTVFDWSHLPNAGYYKEEPDCTTYDKDGKLVKMVRNYNDGQIYRDYTDKNWKIDMEYDKDGNVCHTVYDRLSRNDFRKGDWCTSKKDYNPDGSYVEKLTICCGDDEIKYFDKNERLTKKKVLNNNNGVLKFTVTPKYNKDGDLIKNDTIWNK